MHRLLWAVAALIIVVDLVWAALVHFDIDPRGYLFVAEVAAAVGALALFYGHIRKDEKLCDMLSGTAFLIVFSAAFGLLNYMLLTVAGPRIDAPLAAIDQALGFRWVAVMTFMAHHPLFNFVLQCFYNSVLPQIALTVLVLGWAGRTRDIFCFCLSVAVGAFVTVGFWTLFPSLGAFSFYHLPANVAAHLAVVSDSRYAQDLVHLFNFGPGRISPRDMRGLIAFPSFHGALAIMAAWYATRVKHLAWPAAILNAGVLVSIPIQGGHHMIDIFGGLAVAAFALWISGRMAVMLESRPQSRIHHHSGLAKATS
jgi:hypothetical protein